MWQIYLPFLESCFFLKAHGKEELFTRKTTLDDLESFDLKVTGIFDVSFLAILNQIGLCFTDSVKLYSC